MTQPFAAASHHDVLVLLIQIAVLLFTARMLGELAQRLGQPSVVGEILAGIVLGPSCLSAIFPFVEEWIIPQTPTQGYLLEAVGLLGVMFLLLITGLETDLVLIRRQARSAIGVAMGGLLLPLFMGFLLGQFIPENLLVKPDDRLVFSLYLAIAMSISALPVIAKVLMDLNLTRRDIGQTIIASAMIDDTVGWILLSVVIGLAGGAAVNAGTVLESVLSVLGFMAISFTLGQWLVNRLVNFVQQKIASRDKMLSLLIILTFIWGAISQALNLEAMLGAFALGILFSRVSRLDIEVVHKVESMALGIFAPIFFAIAGLKVNIINLLEPDLLVVAALIIGVATFCKIVGVYIGARTIGKTSHWTALFYGSGLNARGSMGIIVASIGLSLGLVTQDMFSLIVLMAVITSVLAPALLRVSLNNIEIDQQEQDRLRREAFNRNNIIANVNQILLPVRVRPIHTDSPPTQVMEAHLVERLGANKTLALTLMSVSRQENEAQSQAFLTHIGQLFHKAQLTRKLALDVEPIGAILDEVKKSYDLMILGASERQANTASLFSPVIDELVRLSPSPTLIAHAPQALSLDWQPKHILVATTGSQAGRQAAQLGFSLAANTDTALSILQVIRRNGGIYSNTDMERREMEIAHEIVNELKEMGQLFGVNATGLVETGHEPEITILEVAQKQQVDLIILGTNVRSGSERLYLGPKVERILTHSHCPVIVFNTA